MATFLHSFPPNFLFFSFLFFGAVLFKLLALVVLLGFFLFFEMLQNVVSAEGERC